MFSPHKLTPLSQRLGLAMLAALVVALFVSATYLARSLPDPSAATSPSPCTAFHTTWQSPAPLADSAHRRGAAFVSPRHTPEGEVSADELREECQRLSDHVSSLAQKRQELHEQLERLSLGGNGMNEEQLEREKVLVAQLETQYAALRKLTPENLPEALGIVQIEDAVIAQLDIRLRQAVAEAAALRQSGISSNSPQFLELARQIEGGRQQLQDMLDNILRAQATKLEIEKAALGANQESFAAQRENERLRQELMAEYRQTDDALNAAASLLYQTRLSHLLPTDHIRNWRLSPPRH